MNHSKQILWHIILISLMNAMTYIYFGTYIWLYTPLFYSTLFAIIYYSLQLSLLYHIAKSSSKLIYFPPFIGLPEFSEFYVLHFHEGTSFLRLSKKFFTFLSLFGMLDVYLELFCLN